MAGASLRSSGSERGAFMRLSPVRARGRSRRSEEAAAATRFRRGRVASFSRRLALAALSNRAATSWGGPSVTTAMLAVVAATR